MTPLHERDWQPATFRDRGVAVPFTSPMLAGARTRINEGRHELVVPHPGGSRGVYIFALDSLDGFCAPTLHDLRLAERLPGMGPLSPATMRLVARAVAAEGCAGRAAASAALAAQAHDTLVRDRFQRLLLGAIVRQAGSEAVDASERLAHAVRTFARRTGRDEETVKVDIGLLSTALTSAGLQAGPSPTAGAGLPGRCVLQLDRIVAMGSGMQAWVKDSAAALSSAEPACSMVAASALAILALARPVLAMAQKLLDDPAALLGAWASSPDVVAARLYRPDWVLDGWEHLCLIWHVAETDEDRGRAIAEIASQIPSVPQEIEAWAGSVPDPRLRIPAAVASPAPATGLAARAVPLVARNELIRALSA